MKQFIGVTLKISIILFLYYIGNRILALAGLEQEWMQNLLSLITVLLGIDILRHHFSKSYIWASAINAQSKFLIFAALVVIFTIGLLPEAIGIQNIWATLLSFSLGYLLILPVLRRLDIS